MIPSLIILLLRRYQKRHPEKVRHLVVRLRFAARIALLLLAMTGIALYAFAQDRVLQYTVKRSGTMVGNLVVKEKKTDDRITYHLQSAVKSSFLVTVAVHATEEAVYEKGILTYSRFYQKVNNNERVNTYIHATGSDYTVISKTEKKLLKKYPITYNMVCLYTMEPLHVTTVFSDKFRKFLPIETVGPHHYRIRFPEGGDNEYYYQSGLCVKVKLNGTWFSAEMELKR
jgi:hypothetical protein